MSSDYSLPQPIWLSFFSRRMYRAVAEKWRARTTVYLGLVLVLCWTPAFVQTQKSLDQAFRRIRAEWLPKIPAMTLRGGELKTAEARIYELDLDPASGLRVVIDTSGNLTTLEQARARVLVGPRSVLVRSAPGRIQTYELSRAQDMTLDAARLRHFTDIFERWTPRVLYPLLFVGSYLKRLFQALITALCGLLLLRWVNTEMSFSSLFTLAVVSMTPSLILESVLSLSGGLFPLSGILLGAVGFGYFLFGFNAATDAAADDDGQTS